MVITYLIQMCLQETGIYKKKKGRPGEKGVIIDNKKMPKIWPRLFIEVAAYAFDNFQ